MCELIVVGGFSHPVSSLCLQHEKYTSQLQLSLKALEAKVKDRQQVQSSDKSKDAISTVKVQDKGERRAHSLTGKPSFKLSWSWIWIQGASVGAHELQEFGVRCHDQTSALSF